MHLPSRGGICAASRSWFDWYGQGAHLAEWRNKTIAIMTARLMDQTEHHETSRQHASAVRLSVLPRVD
eukprot:9493883-Pyramimonas_sp.AAC.1